MANTCTDFNTAPAANGPALLAKLKPAYPAAALKTIQALSAKIDRVTKERAKWLAPEASAAIVKRRAAAHADPSDANLAALSVESENELRARYETAAHELHGLITEVKRGLHRPYLELLAAIRKAVNEGLEELEQTNRKAHAALGVPYDPAEDFMRLSVQRFMECAAGKLDNERCVCDPVEALAFIGPIRGGGWFS